MTDFLSFAHFSLLEAKATGHFRDRMAERTFAKNVNLGMPKSFWDNFPQPETVDNNIKAKLAKLVEDRSYLLLGKTYTPREAYMAMLLDPKIEHKGKIYKPNLQVTAKDKKGENRTLTGPYWAVILDDTLVTIFNSEDKGDDSLLLGLKSHLKREHPEKFDSLEKFSIDRKTADPLEIIKLSDDGEVLEDVPKHISLNVKEFQSVVRPGMDITYYGFGPDKTIVKKTAKIESISRLDGKPIDFKQESDVTPGIKVFFTNKASKSFIPNKDVIVVDGHRAEITKIFLDKRMATPINFMLKVKSIKE